MVAVGGAVGGDDVDVDDDDANDDSSPLDSDAGDQRITSKDGDGYRKCSSRCVDGIICVCIYQKMKYN